MKPDHLTAEAMVDSDRQHRTDVLNRSVWRLSRLVRQPVGPASSLPLKLEKRRTLNDLFRPGPGPESRTNERKGALLQNRC